MVMSELEELGSENGLAESPEKPLRRRRGVYLLPSFLTVGNLLCGYYAILMTLKGTVGGYDAAAKAIGLAIVFDMLDGRVARATHTSSELGKQFDSLADVISFGVAPALLAFDWGVHGLLLSMAPLAIVIYRLGWVVAFAYLICCAWRLARFNIQGMAPERPRAFVGLPTPAAAGMIAATVHAVQFPLSRWWLSLLWVGLVLLLALLMASTVRYMAFKEIRWRRRQSSLTFILIGLLIAAILMFSRVVLLTIATLYLLTGIIGRILRQLRHRPSAPASDAHA
jgi:CDP-diacylglycerol--serine O-phosphatidyltransferase